MEDISKTKNLFQVWYGLTVIVAVLINGVIFPSPDANLLGLDVASFLGAALGIALSFIVMGLILAVVLWGIGWLFYRSMNSSHFKVILLISNTLVILLFILMAFEKKV